MFTVDLCRKKFGRPRRINLTRLRAVPRTSAGEGLRGSALGRNVHARGAASGGGTRDPRSKMIYYSMAWSYVGCYVRLLTPIRLSCTGDRTFSILSERVRLFLSDLDVLFNFDRRSTPGKLNQILRSIIVHSWYATLKVMQYVFTQSQNHLFFDRPNFLYLNFKAVIFFRQMVY